MRTKHSLEVTYEFVLKLLKQVVCSANQPAMHRKTWHKIGHSWTKLLYTSLLFNFCSTLQRFSVISNYVSS